MDEKHTRLSQEAQPAIAVAKLDVTLFGEALHIEIPIPAGPVDGTVLIPIARALAEAIGRRAIEADAAAGRHLSCRRGCTACCHQLVALSVAEARRIHALVEAMPEPRRSTVRARFAAIRTALHEAGLLAEILDTAQIPAETMTATSLRYLSLRPACPFLDDGSCSIYDERPIGCREYMVTSPPAFCADPAAGKIEGVPRPLRLHVALIRSDPESPPERPTWVALPTALDWAAAHPAPDTRVPGPDLLRRFLTEAFRHDIAAAGVADEDAATTEPPPAPEP